MNSDSDGILKPYTPTSWFHPVGVHKVLNRFRDRLPDVGGSLFLTLTVDPKLFADAASAYDRTRDDLRRLFFKLRRGVEHEGKLWVIDAPYCVKTEFHENGWAHYHVVFLTRRFLAAELLAKLWGNGRVNVQRIKADQFSYLLKYVTKAGDLPDWVKSRKRIRVFQTSRGFLSPADQSKTKRRAALPAKPHRARASYTIEERHARWERMAVLVHGTHIRQVLFTEPFRELFGRVVLPIARVGRYRGNGEITIKPTEEMILWLMQQSPIQR
jgi:hypothetical protein